MVVDCLKRLAEYRGVAPRGEGEKSINKGQMADRLAARTGLNKAATRVAVDSVFETIGDPADNIPLAGLVPPWRQPYALHRTPKWISPRCPP